MPELFVGGQVFNFWPSTVDWSSLPNQSAPWTVLDQSFSSLQLVLFYGFTVWTAVPMALSHSCLLQSL